MRELGLIDYFSLLCKFFLEHSSVFSLEKYIWSLRPAKKNYGNICLFVFAVIKEVERERLQVVSTALQLNSQRDGSPQKLRKLERILRVLECAVSLNIPNQRHVVAYQSGSFVKCCMQ